MAALTEAQLKSKVAAARRAWSGLCQALVWNVANWTGGAKMVYPSAKSAYQHSNIVSKDATKAPAGAAHYWDRPATYGHVAVGLGGERVLMASSYVDQSWGDHVGVTTVSRYTKRTGARYLGWSRTNGVNVLGVKPAVAKSSDAADVRRLASWLNGQKLGYKTTAWSDGVRGPVYWQLVQLAGRRAGIYGAGYKVDGKPGAQSRTVEKVLLARL